MNIACSIYNEKELNNNLDYIDSAILMNTESLIESNNDLDKLINICKDNNIEPIIALDRIYKEKELSSALSIIDRYKLDNQVLFYITDFGILNYIIKNNLNERTIFNPMTMITNYLDLDFYKNLNLKAISMSNEITLEDLILSYDKTKSNLFYLVFGYKLMFYSNRSLISLYKEKSNIEINSNKLYLKEETRNDYYPIIENNHGTMIFRSYLISLLSDLDKINFLKYIYLDSLYLDANLFSDVLKSTRLYIDNKISFEELNKKINDLNLHIEDGFKYVDSVYQKEELKNV